AQRGGDFSHRRIRLHRPAHIFCRSELLAGDLCETCDGLLAVMRMGVDTGAHRRATESQFSEVFRVSANVFAGFANRQSISRKFLTEANWDSILHMCATGLHYVVKLFALGLTRGS